MQKKSNRRGGKRQRAFSVFAASILLISSLGSGLAGMTVSAEGTESITEGFEDGDFTDGDLTIDNGTVENVDCGEVTSYDAENSGEDGTVDDSMDDPENLIDDSTGAGDSASDEKNSSSETNIESNTEETPAEDTTEEISSEAETSTDASVDTVNSLTADISYNGDIIGKVEIDFDDPISSDTTLSVEVLEDEKLYNRALTAVLENGGTDIEDVDILQFSFGSSDGGMGVCPNDGATVTIEYNEDSEITDQTARVMEFGEDPGFISDTKIKTSDRDGHTYIDSYSFKYNFEKNGSDDGKNTMPAIATFLSAKRTADDGEYYIVREGTDGSYYAMKNDGTAVKVNLSDGQITVTDEAAGNAIDSSLVTGNADSSLVVGDVAGSSIVSDDSDEDGKIATDSDIAKNSKTITEGGSRDALIWTKIGDRLYSSDYAQINVSPETVGTAAVSTSHTANVIVSKPDENGMSSIYSVDFTGEGLDRSAEYYALTMDESSGVFTTTELDSVPENHTILVSVNDADDSDDSVDEDKKTEDSAEADSDLAESALEESAAPDIPAVAQQINRAPARVPASSDVTVNSVTAELQGGLHPAPAIMIGTALRP